MLADPDPLTPEVPTAAPPEALASAVVDPAAPDTLPVPEVLTSGPDVEPAVAVVSLVSEVGLVVVDELPLLSPLASVLLEVVPDVPTAPLVEAVLPVVVPAVPAGEAALAVVIGVPPATVEPGETVTTFDSVKLSDGLVPAATHPVRVTVRSALVGSAVAVCPLADDVVADELGEGDEVAVVLLWPASAGSAHASVMQANTGIFMISFSNGEPTLLSSREMTARGEPHQRPGALVHQVLRCTRRVWCVGCWCIGCIGVRRVHSARGL